MAYTFYIDDETNPKAKAFLEFIKTLDFIRTEENEDFALTEEHMKILNERRTERLEGKTDTFSWESVKKFARNRNRNEKSF